MSTDLFVTGTDTGVGKTLLSALLVSALNRKYWKPIQTGSIEGSDRETVLKWVEGSAQETFPERYIFAPPVSPHLAAAQAGVTIELAQIQRPFTKALLIIEGAGGVFVPLNDDVFMLDLIRHLGAPVVVAARSTLGTINHTLLTVTALRSARLDVRGVVMIGHENPDNRQAIERYGNVPVIGSIPWLDCIDRTTLLTVFGQRFDHRAFV